MIRKMLATYRRGKLREEDEVSSRRGWTKAVAYNASRDTLHMAVAMRSIASRHQSIDLMATAMCRVSLAELLLEVDQENRARL